MPTIEAVFKDLQRLVGKKLPMDEEELNETLSYIKGEVESFEEDVVKIEIKDGNRPDLWTVEGVARELKGALGVETGLKDYTIKNSSNVEVYVDAKLESVRPYIAAAIVKGVNLDDESLRGLIQLQEKLDQTYGRRRKRTSIGLYNFDLIKPPLCYKAVKPSEVSFVPLEFTEELDLAEILKKHPKGVEYGHIVKDQNSWPILVDSADQVLSFPPIINSNDLGRVTEDVENILVEVTGTSHQTLLNTLTIVTLSLADRGGDIYSTMINYPYQDLGFEVTPIFEERKMRIPVEDFNKIIGVQIPGDRIIESLRKARYGASLAKSEVQVAIPCYRVDVMHPVDIIEDASIMYGYNNIEPRWPQLPTIGQTSEKQMLTDLVREIMIGFGYQEILTFSMTNKQRLFENMNLEETRVVEVSNPKTLTYTCLRSWLTPSLVEFLSSNTHIEYPQRIFEVGDVVVLDETAEERVREERKLACLSAHADSNFNEAKSVLDAFFLNLGKTYELKEIRHDSFIAGRVGGILVDNIDAGVIGELAPGVLENWKIGNPTAAFEIALDKLFPV